MSIPVEPIFSCYLNVLKQAISHGRYLAYQNKDNEKLGDLLDAVHVVPELLNNWEACDEKGLFRYLEKYDNKWVKSERDFSLVKIFQETYDELKLDREKLW